MGLGLLAAGGLAGLGQAGMAASSMVLKSELDKEERDWLQQRAEQMQIAREDRAETAKIAAEDRAETRRLGPVTRANDAIKGAMAQEVPVAPEEVASLSGDESAARRGSGMLAGAYKGDPNSIVKDISRITSDDDKRLAADALELQLQDAKKANEDAVAGKTRQLSRAEVQDAADRALEGDLEAQALLKKARTEKYTKVGANEALFDNTTGRAVFQNKQGEENLRIKAEAAQALFEMRFERDHGSKAGAKSAFRDTFELIRAEKPDWSADQIFAYMNQGKTPVSTYSQTEKTDPISNKPTVTTVTKGPGTPPAAGKAPAEALMKFNGKMVSYADIPSEQWYTAPDGTTRKKK